jgi:hypothetical protein
MLSLSLALSTVLGGQAHAQPPRDVSADAARLTVAFLAASSNVRLHDGLRVVIPTDTTQRSLDQAIKSLAEAAKPVFCDANAQASSLVIICRKVRMTHARRGADSTSVAEDFVGLLSARAESYASALRTTRDSLPQTVIVRAGDTSFTVSFAAFDRWLRDYFFVNCHRMSVNTDSSQVSPVAVVSIGPNTDCAP